MKPVQIPSFMSIGTTDIELRVQGEEEEKQHGQNRKNND